MLPAVHLEHLVVVARELSRRLMLPEASRARLLRIHSLVMYHDIYKTCIYMTPMSAENPYVLDLGGYLKDVMPGRIAAADPAFEVKNDHLDGLDEHDLWGKIRRESTMISSCSKDSNGRIICKVHIALQRSQTFANLDSTLDEGGLVVWPRTFAENGNFPFVYKNDEMAEAKKIIKEIEKKAATTINRIKDLHESEFEEAQKEGFDIDPFYDELEHKAKHSVQIYMNQMLVRRFIAFVVTKLYKPSKQIDCGMQEAKWYEAFEHAKNPKEYTTGKNAKEHSHAALYTLVQELIVALVLERHVNGNFAVTAWRTKYVQSMRKERTAHSQHVKDTTSMSNAVKRKDANTWYVVFKRCSNRQYMDSLMKHSLVLDPRHLTKIVAHFHTINGKDYKYNKDDCPISPYHYDFIETRKRDNIKIRKGLSTVEKEDAKLQRESR